MDKAVLKHTPCHRYLPASPAAILPLHLFQASRRVLPVSLLEDEHGQKVSCHGLQQQTNGQRGPTMRNSSKEESFLIFIYIHKQSALPPDAITWGSLQVNESLGQPVAKTQPHIHQHHSMLQHPPATTLNEKQAAQKVL